MIGKIKVGTRARRGAALAAVTLLFAASAAPASAQQMRSGLLRDTEIEELLNAYSQPIFKAAGLGSQQVAVRIINNEAFNAFVMDGRSVFMHSGALMIAKTPNEVIGVLAHEAGHIEGGHMASLRIRIAQDKSRMLLAQILGIGAMIGGAVAGGDGGREAMAAGQGVMAGGGELVMRALTAERRSQESAADQAGLKYLNATQQSGQGMLTTFERFANQEMFISGADQNAFARTHPVARDRLARLRQLVEASPYFGAKDSPQLQARHDMMRAKLSGYLEAPGVVFKRYPQSDASVPARYARAIAQFRSGGQGSLEAGVALIDQLIQEQPNNPYFWEVKGDFYQRAGRAQEAVQALRKSLQVAGNGPTLIKTQLAAALLQTKQPGVVDEAINLLKETLRRDEDDCRAYNALGEAFYAKGLQSKADLARAQRLMCFGDFKMAKDFAKRAQAGLKPNSPDWMAADDIITQKPPKTDG
ncbi:MAG: M48 family metalloprotease [Hyphomicrobiaceae bacterium]|nr:M48 family metalloprotease [Hyphomicrobiaceae bacterium]